MNLSMNKKPSSLYLRRKRCWIKKESQFTVRLVETIFTEQKKYVIFFHGFIFSSPPTHYIYCSGLYTYTYCWKGQLEYYTYGNNQYFSVLLGAFVGGESNLEIKLIFSFWFPDSSIYESLHWDVWFSKNRSKTLWRPNYNEIRSST